MLPSEIEADELEENMQGDLSLLILPSDLLEEGDDERQRRVQASEVLQEKVCRSFLHLNTTEAPAGNYDLFDGIIFRLRSKNVPIEIQTLELELDDFETVEVKVYTKLGEYNETGNVFQYTDSWELVTTENAFAVATAERKNFGIIPNDQFRNIVMEPKESRLIYVALSSDVPLLKSATEETKFDQSYAATNELATHVGYAVTGSNLFGETTENRPFHGIVHYETKLPCEDLRDAFSMELPYFVNKKDPPAAVTSYSLLVVQTAVEKGMSLDAKLIRMQNIGGLRFQNTETETNVVPHEGGCPFGWEECSKLIIKINFGHDERLNPGLVHYEILRFVQDYNTTSAGFELGYVGKMPLALDYFIDLAGVPKVFELDEAQEVYYGAQTTKFLVDMTGEDILAVGLTPTKRNKPSEFLSNNEPTRRRLQGGSNSKNVETTIYGAYTAWPEPQHPHSVRGVDSMATVETLQTAFDENGTLYMQYLKDGLLRPGPVNEGNRADFFKNITGIDAELDENSLWMPTSAPTPMPTIDPDAEARVWGMPKSTLKALAILMLIVGFLLLLFVIYWEYQYRKEEKEKSKRNARAAQRKVDKLRAEQYRRITEKKKRIQDNTSSNDSSISGSVSVSGSVSINEEDENSLTEPMIT